MKQNKAATPAPRSRLQERRRKGDKTMGSAVGEAPVSARPQRSSRGSSLRVPVPLCRSRIHLKKVRDTYAEGRFVWKNEPLTFHPSADLRPARDIRLQGEATRVSGSARQRRASPKIDDSDPRARPRISGLDVRRPESHQLAQVPVHITTTPNSPTTSTQGKPKSSSTVGDSSARSRREVQSVTTGTRHALGLLAKGVAPRSSTTSS